VLGVCIPAMIVVLHQSGSSGRGLWQRVIYVCAVEVRRSEMQQGGLGRLDYFMYLAWTCKV
jgi:hypothetical protein